MYAILKLVEKLRSIEITGVVRAIISDPQFKKFIIELNTQDQLFNKGINSLGVSLETIGGPYSPNTIEGVPGLFEGKKEKGLPFDHITLFSEGDFYESFRIEIGLNHFRIIANGEKDDGNLFDDWGPEIVGLTQESKQKIVERLRLVVGKAYKQAYRAA